MGLFDDINTRISENLQHHGYYLTDPHAAEDEQIAETIDILIHCVRPERREAVRVQIIDILRCEAIPTKVLRVQDRLPVHLVSASSLQECEPSPWPERAQGAGVAGISRGRALAMTSPCSSRKRAVNPCVSSVSPKGFGLSRTDLPWPRG